MRQRDLREERFRLRYEADDVSLYDGTFVIGRAEHCDLALACPRVSREHARLEIDGQIVTVEDVSARNGIVLNGRRLDTRAKVRLRKGDQLLIGSKLVSLLGGRSSAPIETPVMGSGVGP